MWPMYLRLYSYLQRLFTEEHLVYTIHLIRPSLFSNALNSVSSLLSRTPPPPSSHRQLDLPFSQVPHDDCFLFLPLPSGILQHFLSLLLRNLLLSFGHFTRLTVHCQSAFLLTVLAANYNSNQTSRDPLRTLFSLRRPNWVTETVSLTVPCKYSTEITILNTHSPCVITKATCLDCLHFKMSFYSSDKTERSLTRNKQPS